MENSEVQKPIDNLQTTRLINDLLTMHEGAINEALNPDAKISIPEYIELSLTPACGFISLLLARTSVLVKDAAKDLSPEEILVEQFCINVKNNVSSLMKKFYSKVSHDCKEVADAVNKWGESKDKEGICD